MEGQQKRQWGLTHPISEAPPTEADLKLNDQLIDYLKARDNFESPEGTEKRNAVLKHIGEVAKEFMRRVGKAKKLSQSTIDSLGGTVRTFGSFALGVYGPSSDIDTLIVAPRQILYDDFFKHFPQIFREMSDASEITELNPVPDAFVPIIKMEYRGVSIDLIFASLPTQSSISQDIDLTDVNMLRGMDQTMMRSLNGTRVTKELLDSVPQVKSFRYALRAIKLWSNQRGIYGAVFGYPGGIAWAIMVARICQLFPYACGATIVSKFFNLMRQWHWPRPVMLKDIDQHSPLNLPVWNPQHSHLDRAHLMPIITPAYPQMCSTHSVMQSTKAVMLTEFERANEIIGSITAGKRPWDDLFKRHTFFTDDHKYYLSVVATGNSKEAHEAFKGLVQSKVRILAKGIEESGAVDCARPYMKGFERIHRCNEDQLDRVKQGVVDFQISEEEVPSDGAQPSNGDKIVYTATFYIGLKLPMEEGSKVSLDISTPVSDFRYIVTHSPVYDEDTMSVRIVHTRSHQLPDDCFQAGETKPTKPVKEKKKRANGTKPAKRQFAETGLEDSGKSTKKRVSEANGLPAPLPA